jgi:hypothetical protein
VAPFLHPARLDALELLREEGLADERDASAGELRMSGMGSGELCEGSCSFVHAVCVLASARSRKCHWGFSRVLCAFVTFVIFVVPACRIESIPIA